MKGARRTSPHASTLFMYFASVTVMSCTVYHEKDERDELQVLGLPYRQGSWPVNWQHGCPRISNIEYPSDSERSFE